MIFWNQRWAFWFTAVMFILNNTFIMVRTTAAPSPPEKHLLTDPRVSTASSAQSTSTP